MTAALLTAALLSLQPALRPATARQLARVSLDAEVRHGLPAGLLVAIASVESYAGRKTIGYNRNGSCDAGLYHANVPGCAPMAVAIIRAASVEVQSEAAAKELKRIEVKRAPKGRCRWYRWNPGSRGWCSRVLKVHRRLKAHAVKSKPST